MFSNNLLKTQYLLFSIFNEKSINYVIENKFMIYDDFKNINFNYNEQYLLEDLVWHYNNNNYRIPYYNNVKIQFIKLNNDINIYNYISSSSIIPESEIISGEIITSLTDIFIGTNSSLTANPNTDKYINNKKEINSISNLNLYNIIFVKTDDINLFYNKFNLNNKIIVTHNSDFGINASHIPNIDKCKKQLSQNCLIEHPKLIPLPIGIENTQWFDHKLLKKIRIRTDIIKDKNIYFFFSFHTHSSRKECYEKLKNKLEWKKKLSKEDYFMELKRHKYAICPRGNGLDTHRLWECLYLDVIPIMLKQDSVKINNLPIIYLDDWNNFDSTNLESKFKNIELSQITLSYYKEIIINNNNK